MRKVAATLAGLFFVAACSTNSGAEPVPVADAGQGGDGSSPECAHVVAASIEATGAGYTVDATVRSADTGSEKYADAFEVRAPDGTVLGTRILTHPHVDEQPFTRSLTGLEIPAGTTEVTVAARDSVLGFCGDVIVLTVP